MKSIKKILNIAAVLFVTAGICLVSGCAGPYSPNYSNKGQTIKSLKFKVNFNANNGSGSMDSLEGRIGEEIVITDNGFSAPSGDYVFHSWNTKADGTGVPYAAGDIYTVDSEDITLYAIWILKINYSITYVSSESVANANVTSYTIFDDVTLYGLGSSGSKTFVGWYTSASYEDSTKVTGWKAGEREGNIKLYAKWVVISISFDKSSVLFNGASDTPVTVTPTVSGMSVSDIEWTTDNAEIATVNKGTITPAGEGLTVVQAKIGSYVASIAVIVMREVANTTYNTGSEEIDSYTTDKYYSDEANQVAFSLRNKGLDFIGRLKSTDSWKMTTYNNNAWKWRIGNEEVALDTQGNGKYGNLSLSVRPVLAYDTSTGISYVVIYQVLTNVGSTTLTGLKFGSHADIKLGSNDSAPIKVTDYGAMMYDTSSKLAFKVYAKAGDDCTPVNTLWFGYYSNRTSNMYGTSTTSDLTGTDSGMSYSWQNITLKPGESVIKSIKMTLVEYVAE